METPTDRSRRRLEHEAALRAAAIVLEDTGDEDRAFEAAMRIVEKVRESYVEGEAPVEFKRIVRRGGTG